MGRKVLVQMIQPMVVKRLLGTPSHQRHHRRHRKLPGPGQRQMSTESHRRPVDIDNDR